MIIACLQIYQEKLSLATFLRVHSNTKEIFYLPWQNKYPVLKTNCHIKPNVFLRTELPKNLLLAKYLIYATAALINLQLSNENCIYSTLIFVENGSKNLNVDVSCITFNQPHWYKASKISNDKNLNMVCRLSGFRTIIWFFWVVLIPAWSVQVLNRLWP